MTTPTLSDLLATTATQLEARALANDSIGPRELVELAALIRRWSSHAYRLQVMAGACAATIAAAELAEIEAQARAARMQ